MILGSTWVSSNQVINPAAVLPLWQENRASRDALMKASVSNTSKLPLLQLVVVVRLLFGALPVHYFLMTCYRTASSAAEEPVEQQQQQQHLSVPALVIPRPPSLHCWQQAAAGFVQELDTAS
jgi:hypothetical protein